MTTAIKSVTAVVTLIKSMEPAPPWVAGIHDGQITFTCPFCGRVYFENPDSCCDAAADWGEAAYRAERRQMQSLWDGWLKANRLEVPEACGSTDEAAFAAAALARSQGRNIDAIPAPPGWHGVFVWPEEVEEANRLFKFSLEEVGHRWLVSMIGHLDQKEMASPIPFRGAYINPFENRWGGSPIYSEAKVERLRQQVRAEANRQLLSIRLKNIKSLIQEALTERLPEGLEPSRKDIEAVQDNLKKLLPPELRWQIFGNRRYIM